MITFPSRTTVSRSDSFENNNTTHQPQPISNLKRSKSKSRLRSEKHQDDSNATSNSSRRRVNSESSTPKRNQSKKEKINAVSKASLAMLDPRHAMGMDSEFGQHSYSGQNNEEDELERGMEQYDGIWRDGNKSGAKDKDGSGNLAGRGRKNAASTLPKWADQKIDPAWQMSPTPTLEAFATGNNFDSDAPSSLGQVISNTTTVMVQEEEPEQHQSFSFEIEDRPKFVSVFEDDQEPISPHGTTLHRQGTLSRVMLRTGSDQSDGSLKSRTKSQKEGSQNISSNESNLSKSKFRKSSVPNAGNQIPSLPSSNSSISRFFSWKRANKDKNTPAPLVLSTLRNPSDSSKYPYGASSAPPNVSTFEDADRLNRKGNNSGSAPANVTTFEEAAARANGKDSNREQVDFSSLFGHGFSSSSSLDLNDTFASPSSRGKLHADRSQAMGISQSSQGSNGQEHGKRISTLGRKHSLPTVREQERARNSVWIPPSDPSSASVVGDIGSNLSQAQPSSEEGESHSTFEALVSLPVLPAIPICSSSPTLFATPAWEASLSRFMDEPSSPSSWSISTGTSGKSLSRVSTHGRGVPNRKSLFEPSEPMPAFKGSKQSSPVKETQIAPLRSDSAPSETTNLKALRRISRSVGSFNAPPPLSSFGSPPTFFSPNTPDVPLFSDGNMSSSPSMISSPSLGFGRGRGTFQTFEQQHNPPLGIGLGRGRGRGISNGTPTQRSVSTFSPIVIHQPQSFFKEDLPLRERMPAEVVRDLRMSSSGAGTPKLGHSPSDSTDSIASITASSEVHVSTQQARRVNLHPAGRAVPVGVASPSLVRSPRSALTKTLTSDLIVTVMPPTPDLRPDSPNLEGSSRMPGQAAEDDEECLDDAYGEGMTNEVAQDIERSFDPASPSRKVKASVRSPGSWRRRDTCIIDGPENMKSPRGLGLLELDSLPEPRSSVVIVSSGQQLPVIVQDQDTEFYGLPYMESKDESDTGLGLGLGMETIMRRRVDSHSSLRSDISGSTGSAEPFGFSRSLSSMSLASDASSLGGSASSGSFSNIGSSTTDLTSPAKSFKSSSSYHRDLRADDESEDHPPLVPMLQFGSDKSIHEKTETQQSPIQSSPSAAPPSNNFLGVGLPLRTNNLSSSSISSAMSGLSGITASTSILNLEEDQELEAAKFAKEQGLLSHRSRLQQDARSQGPLRTAFSYKTSTQFVSPIIASELNEDDCETPKLGPGSLCSPNSQTSSPFSQPRTSPIEETESELRSAIAELPATWLSNSQSHQSTSPAQRRPTPPKPPKSRARSNSVYQNSNDTLQIGSSNGSETSTSPISSPRAPLRPLALVQQAQGKKEDKVNETTRPLFIKRPSPRIANHNVNRGKENTDPISKRSTHYVNQLASPLSTSTSSRFTSSNNFSPSSPRTGMDSPASTPSPPLSGLGIGLGFDFGAKGSKLQRSPSWRSDISTSNEWMGVAM